MGFFQENWGKTTGGNEGFRAFWAPLLMGTNNQSPEVPTPPVPNPFKPSFLGMSGVLRGYFK